MHCKENKKKTARFTQLDWSRLIERLNKTGKILRSSIDYNNFCHAHTGENSYRMDMRIHLNNFLNIIHKKYLWLEQTLVEKFDCYLKFNNDRTSSRIICNNLCEQRKIFNGQFDQMVQNQNASFQTFYNCATECSQNESCVLFSIHSPLPGKNYKITRKDKLICKTYDIFYRDNYDKHNLLFVYIITAAISHFIHFRH
ncbi:hypothetical protein SNEBB_005358 [Seison nebaliae]|nr:hypothetical protein SNEBB_005358 [Seison nebaliae]